MKISELERCIVDNKFTDAEFVKFIEKIETKFEYDYDSIKKLSDEEVDYNYFDDTVVKNLEELDFEEHSGYSHDCSCGDDCNEEHHFHKENNSENFLENRFNKSMYLVYIMALYLLREGIHYIDLVQDGLVGLINANNLYQKEEDFEKYRQYFIAKEMISHINDYSLYRKVAFREYIEVEKNKELKGEFSSKVRMKLKNETEEIKKLEAEKNKEHKKEIEKLENFTRNMFDYHNLKYRLSLREIQVLSCYFGFDRKGKKSLVEINKILKIGIDDVDKILKEGIYKLSMTMEKVEI